MKRLLITICIALLFSCEKDTNMYVEIITDYGVMKVMLYNETPKHRDNFIKLVNKDYYNDLLFHRVINSFMIQGGDPDSKTATPEQLLGGGGPGYELDAEIKLPHVKGALAAARLSDQVNPERKSSGSQFFIVHGRPFTDEELNAIQMQNNISFSEEQLKFYKETGGAPFLDGQYTVFGQVVEGVDVLDKIAAVPTGTADRPIRDLKMKIRIVK
ncbi:MAG: peptidylprolyl isomerase [Saprospiraceae bacterium]|nr:peptidylprolyl isomerase [Saprospiraceae bacterium]